MAQREKNGGKSKSKDAAVLLPDKKKHEDELEVLMVEIREKEAAIKSLGRSGGDRDAQKEVNTQRDKLYTDFSKVKSQKDALVEKRHSVDVKIREVNDVISKKSDEANKMSATLRYKSAERVDAALASLENRKARQQTAQEETDLQTEITELTDSKPVIISYNECRQDIDKERARHSDLRRERDAITDELSTLRVSEDDLRTDLDKCRGRIDKEKLLRKSQNEERDGVHRELDQLYTQRRDKITAFRQAQNDFHRREMEAKDAAMAKRDEERRKARQERALEKEGRQQEKLEWEAATDPKLAIRQTCASLIAYLQRMAIVDTNGTATSGSADSAARGVDSLTPVRGDEAKPGAFLSRKTRDEDAADSLFAGYGGKGKKGKKGKKSSGSAAKAATRAIKHNTVVLQQFMEVDVKPPASAVAVPAILEELKQRETECAKALVEKYGKNSGLDAATSDAVAASVAAPVIVANGTAAAPAVCNGDSTVEDETASTNETDEA